jgi:hypothetical protein
MTGIPQCGWVLLFGDDGGKMFGNLVNKNHNM